MAHYPISRLLLSMQNPPSSPTIAIETPIPGYSDTAIILTCLLCSIICVVGVLALIRWTCFKPPSSALSTVSDQGVPSECFKKKIVGALPRLIFKSVSDTDATVSAAATSASAAECVICLSEFLDGQEIRVLPKCAHVFHVECIDKWLIEFHSFCCPSCRQVLTVNQYPKCKSDASASPRSRPEADFLP